MNLLVKWMTMSGCPFGIGFVTLLVGQVAITVVSVKNVMDIAVERW
jgi:hypothetical protein